MRMALARSGVVVLGLLLLAACSGTQVTPITTPAATVVAKTTPTPTPTPIPTVTPTPTPIVAPRLESTTSTAGPPSLEPSGLEGLWAGGLDIPGLADSHPVPWLALRLIPGENPEVDPWRFEGGPFGLPTFQCSPERRGEGWNLVDCVAAGESRPTPFLGVMPGTLGPEKANELGVPTLEGVLIIESLQGGPAWQGGVRTGDVLMSIEGDKISSIEDLLRILNQAHAVGDEVAVKVFREEQEITLSVTLGERPDPHGAMRPVSAFVPAPGEGGLEVKFERGPTTFSATLTRVHQRDEPRASDNVKLLWHEAGDGIHSDIWAADGLVFAPRFDGRIEILDATSGKILSTATVPEARGGRPDIASDAKARDGLLYVATAFNGLVVFDVSQPSSPQLIGQHRVFSEEDSPDNFTNIHNISISPDGNFVYAINQSFPNTDLRVIDVSDPTSPKEAGRFAIDDNFASGQAHDIHVIEYEGRLIGFLNYLAAGLWITDVTDPASISVLSSTSWDGIFSHSGWAFPLGGKLYYAHTEEGYDKHLTILDVTDLANPQVVSHFNTRPGLSIHNVQVAHSIAYISYYVDGLRVVDVRDPKNPREIGHFDTVPDDDERNIIQGAFGIRVLDDIVYISDMETGTYAFQVDLD